MKAEILFSKSLQLDFQSFLHFLKKQQLFFASEEHFLFTLWQTDSAADDGNQLLKDVANIFRCAVTFISVSALVCVCCRHKFRASATCLWFANTSSDPLCNAFASSLFSSLLTISPQVTLHVCSSLRTWCRQWGHTSGSASSASLAASVAPQRTMYV